MGRPVTLFTGQWADLSLEAMCEKAKAFGYDGLELACWGDFIDAKKAAEDSAYAKSRLDILAKYDLKCHAISNHLAGQCVCDEIDGRHKSIDTSGRLFDGIEVSPSGKVSEKDAETVRARAAKEMVWTAQAAKNMGVKIVNGFTGSSIWKYLYSFPPVPDDWIKAGYDDFSNRWLPILSEFTSCGVKFALEVHPTEIAFDTASAEHALKSVHNHAAFGFNFDPSHLVYQNVNYVGFVRKFAARIWHVHMKDAYMSATQTEAGVFGGHINFGDSRRTWDFRSLGRGSIKFEEIIRALNDAKYAGPLSVEWEDGKMNRDHGAREACQFVRDLDFPSSDIAFDAQFDKSKQASAETAKVGAGESGERP